MKRLSLECQLWLAKQMHPDKKWVEWINGVACIENPSNKMGSILIFDLTDKATLYEIIEWLGKAHNISIRASLIGEWTLINAEIGQLNNGIYTSYTEAILAACEYLYEKELNDG